MNWLAPDYPLMSALSHDSRAELCHFETHTAGSTGSGAASSMGSQAAITVTAMAAAMSPLCQALTGSWDHVKYLYIIMMGHGGFCTNDYVYVSIIAIIAILTSPYNANFCCSGVSIQQLANSHPTPQDVPS